MWLQILWFLIVAVATILAYLFIDWLPIIIVGAICSVIIIWVLGCIFLPAIPDRRCPHCGKEGLVKIRKGEPLGVRCEICGHCDEQKHVAYLDEW